MADCFYFSKCDINLILWIILLFAVNNLCHTDENKGILLVARVELMFILENDVLRMNGVPVIPACVQINVCDYLWPFQPCLAYIHNGCYHFHSSNRHSGRCMLATLLLLLTGRVPYPGPTQDSGSISLHHLNINSMVSKGPLLRDLIEKLRFTLLSETKLKADDTDFTRFGDSLEHYSGCDQDRTSDTRGGGLAVTFWDSLSKLEIKLQISLVQHLLN